MAKRTHKKGLSRRPRGAAPRARRSQANRPAYARAPGKGHAHEAGFVDFPTATINLDTTGYVQLLAVVPVGPSSNERIGKRIMLKSLQLRGSVWSGTNGVVARYAWMIVYDKRPTMALPTLTDIIDTASPLSFNNDDNSGRFRILRRMDGVQLGDITPGSGNLLDNSYGVVKEFIDLKGKPTVFKSAGTGSMGDIEEGALYFVAIGDQAPGPAAPSLGIHARIRYVDV